MSTDQNWIQGCEKEALALSGAIQGHGALLHLDCSSTVSHVSANVQAYLPVRPEDLLGQPLPAALNGCLEACLASLPDRPGSRREIFGISVAQGMQGDAVVTRSHHGVVIELLQRERRPVKIPAHTVPMKTPSDAASQLRLHQTIARMLQDLSGFNRVMIYAFREDGDGEVLAEARHADVYGSYLGLRFPASDIPQTARALYLKNPWRLIPDSRSPAVPLLSLTGEAPDLSWSDLRSVSPVHLAYLANMGVRASLSLPIVQGGELWGLLACHHAEPRALPLKTLHTASLVARHYSMVISTWMAEARMRFVDNLDLEFASLRSLLPGSDALLSSADAMASGLLSLFDASAMAVQQGTDWATSGQVPPADTLHGLSCWMEAQPATTVMIDSLVQTVPALAKAADLPVAGALALKLKTRRHKPVQVWLFRPELVQSVQWGGNPHKPVEFIDGPLKIAPRLSFETWVEKRKGYCRPWQRESRLAAIRLRQLLIELKP